MKIRDFLAARHLAIRGKLFGSRRASYFLLSSGLGREAAKGWIFAAPVVFGLTARAPLSVVLLLALLALPGIAYAVFALVVGYRAYAEWGDRLYDRHTKKLLPPEYRNSESATRAQSRRQTKQLEK